MAEARPGSEIVVTRWQIFLTTAVVALFAAFVHHLVRGPSLGSIDVGFIGAQIAGTLVALLAIAWAIVSIAYLVTGRRWSRETIAKSVSVTIIIVAGFAIFEALRR